LFWICQSVTLRWGTFFDPGSIAVPGLSSPRKGLAMLRALFLLILAAVGDIGSHWDPNGSPQPPSGAQPDFGSSWDPDG
jgi:hypothetical protein